MHTYMHLYKNPVRFSSYTCCTRCSAIKTRKFMQNEYGFSSSYFYWTKSYHFKIL